MRGKPLKRHELAVGPVSVSRRVCVGSPSRHFAGREGQQNGGTEKQKGPKRGPLCDLIGAGDEIRTHDPNLGKVMLYP
jgi:hypothetical protein